jgi:DedD protein
VAKADKVETDKPDATDTAVPAAKPAPKASDKVAGDADDKPATGNVRMVVQVGAFAEAERAREARLKLERAGLKTYTHVAATSQGKRIRVRMGPFATRAEADKAAARAKALGLPAALLWL